MLLGSGYSSTNLCKISFIKVNPETPVIAFREDDVTTGAALYFLFNELQKCIMLGQIPDIVTAFYEAISVKLVHV
jgi:hypothetical protein